MISQETLKNKLAFERVAVMHEVLQSCRHWEIQRTSLWKTLSWRQTINFCRMEAHQQSGITEKRRKESSTEEGNYTSTEWTEKMNRSNPHLWTHTIRTVNDSRKYAITNEHDSCPCQDSVQPVVYQQSKTNIFSEKRLQNHGKTWKWLGRTRVGIY